MCVGVCMCAHVPRLPQQGGYQRSCVCVWPANWQWPMAKTATTDQRQSRSFPLGSEETARSTPAQLDWTWTRFCLLACRHSELAYIPMTMQRVVWLKCSTLLTQLTRITLLTELDGWCG
jgi:hypothetical protein